MRCLYISYDGVLEPLGQSQIIPYLKGLSKRGIEFILCSFEKKHCSSQEAKQQLRGQLREYGINWVNLNYHKSPAVLSTIFDIVNGIVVCFIVALKHRPVAVHARSYVSSAIALVLKKALRVKFIFDMRGFWADERVEGRLWAKKGALYHLVKILEKSFFKNADQIIVLTKGAKKIIADWGYTTDNVSIIPCCVDTDKFSYDAQQRRQLRKQYNLEDKFIMVHTGSLEYWYMLEQMLDYFIAAKQLIPQAHFLFLTRSDKNKIMRLAGEKKINPGDFSVLSASYEQMPRYLAIADMGLIFITPVFSKQASSPTKFAEYLSSGLPVIVNERIGDLEEYVLGNKIGFVVRNFQQQQYRQACSQLLKLLKIEGLSFRCRQVACDNFSLESGVEKYHQVYQRLK